MLGKRPRPPMRRTTSMRVLSSDELAALQEAAAAAPGGPSKRPTDQQRSITSNNKSGGGDGGGETMFMNRGGGETMVMNRGGDGGSSNGNVSGPIVLSPRGSSSSRPRRNSADFFLMDATHFLRSCTLCGRHIAPGRDIYMYKGNTAYCSIECRQQQVTLDEKKEKCSLRSIKKEPLPGASEASTNGGETAAAA